MNEEFVRYITENQTFLKDQIVRRSFMLKSQILHTSRFLLNYNDTNLVNVSVSTYFNSFKTDVSII